MFRPHLPSVALALAVVGLVVPAAVRVAWAEGRPTQLPSGPQQPPQGQRPPLKGPTFNYQPTYAPTTAYGAYPGYYYGPSTAAGSAATGMANVISARGDYNLSTSEAAVNMTQAQSNEIQNRQQYTDTYFQMRQTNTAAREAEAGPKPTMQELVKIAQEGVPTPLSPGEMDPVHGGLAYSDQMQARQAIDEMFAGLKSQIQNIPTMDYMAGRKFLNSLMYTACQSELP